MEKNKIEDILKEAEIKSNNTEISDQDKFLVEQKIDVLKSIN